MEQLSGSIPTCQQAATVAAAQLVQQLGAVVQQAQAQERQISRWVGEWGAFMGCCW